MIATATKLRFFIGIVFDGKNARLAEVLGLSGSTVGRWLRGDDISSSNLKALAAIGLNINWLLDDTDQDMLHMFAYNAAGQLLAAKHLAVFLEMNLVVLKNEEMVGMTDEQLNAHIEQITRAEYYKTNPHQIEAERRGKGPPPSKNTVQKPVAKKTTRSR